MIFKKSKKAKIDLQVSFFFWFFWQKKKSDYNKVNPFISLSTNDQKRVYAPNH